MVGIPAHNGHWPSRRQSLELANRIRAGDRTAESEFAEAFSRRLLVVLLKDTRDPDVAHDCCQKTLLIALTKMRAGKILKPRSLMAFLRCTASNVLIAHFRSEKRYMPLGDQVFLLQSDAGDAAVRSLDAETMQCAIQEVLARLAVPRDREILRRFYLLEEDKHDIYPDLGISPAHFDRVLYRARARLRAVLENEQEFRDILFKCMNQRDAESAEVLPAMGI